MFGTNAITKQKLGDGQTLHIVKGSPWLTLQGEGPYSGRAAVFLRLHGCNLACTFCDTNFSDPDDPVVEISELARLVELRRGKAELVVITGGEPMIQQILPLCRELLLRGFMVQIETAGTVWIEGIECLAKIICSPKTPAIHPMVLKHATAFKYVVDTGMRFEGVIPITATQAGARVARLAAPRPGAPVYLSPLDTGDLECNAANRELVGQLAIAHGCIAGVQLHKMMGLD